MFNQTTFLRTLVLLVQTKHNLNEPGDTQTVSPTLMQNNTFTRCYEGYGCFSIDKPWNSIRRPVALFPDPPHKVNPKFCLLTRSNPDLTNCKMLIDDDITQIDSTAFDPNRWTFFISHGYLESMKKGWVYRMARGLLDREDSNVIIVDWFGGSGPPYTQAVANIRLAAAVATKLILNMNYHYGLSPSKIHLIGHSLGAHLSSYVGHAIYVAKGMRIARITALDPAEPHFSGTDLTVRLDPSDADFVDVIHTDAVPFISGGLGLREPVGHVDFYPNGGSNQPGCSVGVGAHILEAHGSLVGGISKSLGCNHVRSNEYLIESLKPSKCPFLGFQCSSFENFEEGKCTVFKAISEPHMKHPGPPVALPLGLESIRLRDMDVRSTPVKLYLKTAPESPFCRSHYKLSLKISDKDQSRKHGGEIGLFMITLSGVDDDTSPLPLQKMERYYEPGHEYSLVVTGETIGKIRSIKVLWKYQTYMTNPLTWRFVVPKIHVAWIRVQHLETADRFVQEKQFENLQPLDDVQSIIITTEHTWDCLLEIGTNLL